MGTGKQAGSVSAVVSFLCDDCLLNMHLYEDQRSQPRTCQPVPRVHSLMRGIQVSESFVTARFNVRLSARKSTALLGGYAMLVRAEEVDSCTVDSSELERELLILLEVMGPPEAVAPLQK